MWVDLGVLGFYDVSPFCWLLMSRAIRQANMVIIIFCLTSTMSSGSAYTLAPAFLAMEIAYFALDILS